MRRGGFTLVEMTMVLMILGIMAAGVAMRISGPARKAAMSRSIAGLTNMDRTARTYCRNLAAPLKFVWDISGNRAWAERLDGGGRILSEFRPQDGLRIAKVRTAGGSWTSGKIELLCSPGGLTPAFAVRCQDSDGHGKWLFISGLTAQATELDEEKQVDEIFQKIAPRL